MTTEPSSRDGNLSTSTRLLTRKRSFTQRPSAAAIKVAAPPLNPINIEPEVAAAPSTSSPAITFLERIECIEINETRERDGVTYYVLDVFLRRCDSRLPTVLAGLRHGVHTRTTPDYQVERRFSDFRHLRADVFNETFFDPSSVCAYCVEFVMYVRLTLQQPRAITKFTTGTTRRKTMLASFLNDFVRLGRSKEKQNHHCEHHGPVPHLLETFLVHHAHSNNTPETEASTSSSSGFHSSRSCDERLEV